MSLIKVTDIDRPKGLFTDDRRQVISLDKSQSDVAM